MRNKSKILKPLVISNFLIVFVFVIAIFFYFNNPSNDKEYKTVKKIEMNKVYIRGSLYTYPMKTMPRYYIKFKDKNRFVLMFDDAVGTDEGYTKQQEKRVFPEIWIYFGEYEIKDGNYILKKKELGLVRFLDMQAVKDKRIAFYNERKIEVGQKNKGEYGGSIEEIVIPGQDGRYAMVFADDKGKPKIDRFRKPCLLLESLDRKELPDTLEEFRNQYVMDEGDAKKFQELW